MQVGILIILNVFLGRKFPRQHFAIITADGSLQEISVSNENFEYTKDLMKFQKTDEYFGYSDEFGVLYIFNKRLARPITKYHKAFNSLGFEIIPLTQLQKSMWQDYKFFRSQSTDYYFWFSGNHLDTMSIGHYHNGNGI